MLRRRMVICVAAPAALMASRMSASVDASGSAALHRLAERGDIAVGFAALRLPVGLVRPTDLRSLVPVQAQPAQVLEHRCHEIETEAEGIEVVVAQKEIATGGAGALGGEPEGAGVAEVEMARGGRGETAEVAGMRFNHG